jgi:ATP-dependent Lhr-like helicase
MVENPKEYADAERLTLELEQHRIIRNLLPSSWNAFFAKHRRLRDIQLKVIPEILSGADVLVSAPTAGGKTDAVMAPVCELIKQKPWPGLACLYITPTRALVNDLFERLLAKTSQIGICLGRQTGDHSQRAGASILLTTPESLESMLTFRKHVLKDVRLVVLDEIHLLDGTSRGDQLRFLLARLRKYINWRGEDARVQHIAISATVASPRQIADAYMGDNANLISVKGQRSIDCKYVQPKAGKELVDCIADGIQQFEDVSKVLVFVNRRRDVDHYTDWVRERVPKHFEVFGHHGSLGTNQREFVERQYRSSKYAVCIATMTLEIGIDIGDVDLVVCVGPPSNLSSFLQRIGRGCRRRQSATRVLCCSSSAVEETVFRAFELGAKHGIPQVPTAPIRRSVLLQQILAYIRQTDKQRRTEAQLCKMFRTEFEPRLAVETIETIIKDMITSRYLYLHQGIVTLGKLGEEFVDSQLIYSNLDPKTEVPVVERESGRTVAYVTGIKSDRLMIAGDRFIISGQQTPGRISVNSIQHGAGIQSPEYSGKAGPGYSGDTGACLARFLDFCDSKLILLRPGFVFTWFGRLYNTILCNCLEPTGSILQPKSFGIDFGRNVECEVVLDALRRAIESVERRAVKYDFPLEALADCGAHHGLLGSQQRGECRKDWVDEKFLRQWIDRIEICKPLDANDPRIDTLRLLAAV